MIAVTYRRHPLAEPVRGHEVMAGETLADIVRRLTSGVDVKSMAAMPRLSVCIGAWEVAPEQWASTKPKMEVFITAVPQGNTFKMAILIVAAAVITFATAGAGSPVGAALMSGGMGITAAATTSAVIGAAASLAVNLAVNALFPPPKPPAQFRAEEQLDISATQNGVSKNAPIPDVLGFVRVAPKYAAEPLQTVVDNEVFLSMAFCHGFGGLTLSDHRLGDTSLEDYDDVEVLHSDNYQGEAQQFYPGDVSQEGFEILLEEEPAVAFPPHVNPPEIQGPDPFPDLESEPENARIVSAAPNAIGAVIGFAAKSGLFGLGGVKQKFVILPTPFMIEHRVDGAADFTAAEFTQDGVTRPYFVMFGDERNPVRRAAEFSFPAPGNYEIRIRRLGPVNINTGRLMPIDRSRITYFEDVHLTGVTTFQDGAAFNPPEPITATFMKIRATNQLNGVVKTYNAFAKRRALSWSGSEWVADVETNNPADLARYVLQGSPSRRPTEDARIDLESLQAWADYCANKGWTYNKLRDGFATSEEVLTEICAAGRAYHSWVDGRVTFTFEEEAAAITQHFTPANTIGLGSSRVYPDEIHGIRVRFQDESKEFAEEQLTVYADGFDAGTAQESRIEEMLFPGVTAQGNIFKMARYYMAEVALRPERYTFQTDIEGLLCRHGSRVRLTHDVTLHGLSAGYVDAVDGQVATLSEPVVMTPGFEYSLRFRMFDGSWLLKTVSGSGPVDQIELLGDMPEGGEQFAFGLQGRDSALMRVKSIRWQRDLSAEIVLVDDAPGIHLADDGEIPVFDAQLSPRFVDARKFQARDLLARETLVVEAGVLRPRVHLSWELPNISPVSAVRVYRLRVGGGRVLIAELPSSARSLDVFDMEAGAVRFIVVAAMADSGLVTADAILDVDLQGPNSPPPAPQEFSLAGDGDGGRVAVFSWLDQDDVLVSRYIMRYSPATVGGSVGTAIVIAENITGNIHRTAALTGTYFLNSVSAAGVESDISAVAVSNLAGLSGLNVVTVVEDSPAYLGEKDGVVLAGQGLTLESSSNFFDPENVFSADSIFGNVVLQGSYVFAEVVDLGEVFTSRVIPKLVVLQATRGDNLFLRSNIFSTGRFFGEELDGWAVSAQVRHTVDDPESAPVWSDWAEVVASHYTARAYEFKIVLSTIDAAVWPIVTAAEFVVDMPDRNVPVRGVETGGAVLSYVFPGGAFRDVPAVVVTPRNLGVSERMEIGNVTAAGVDVAFYNSADDLVAGTFDLNAAGFGRVLDGEV